MAGYRVEQRQFMFNPRHRSGTRFLNFKIMKKYSIKYRKDNGNIKGKEYSYEVDSISILKEDIEMILFGKSTHIEIDLIQ